MIKSMRPLLYVFLFISNSLFGAGKLPEIDPSSVVKKIEEILKGHASYKTLSPELTGRILINYIEELDPNKTYFVESDIADWKDPSEYLQIKVMKDIKDGNFQVFFDIHEAMVKAIKRRRSLDMQIRHDELPEHVNPNEFKDMKWAQNEEELLSRLSRLRALRLETSQKLTEELQEKALQRIEKHQAKYEEEILEKNPLEKNKLILSKFLKAFASSLDAHTSYFTPGEASQFMISVQQRLFGIGAQLRDDLNGFTVVKLLEGGPAALGKKLKAKDRIVAVDGEPVVGLDIIDAVELIRGPENTPVTLTVIREIEEGEEKKEKRLDITIIRGEVILKETRFESTYEPFGDGVIAYLRLYSFYQDPESSSAQDLEKELERLKKEHNVKGVILDLRYNTGGMLSQAVAVTGLFITKGVVVSIMDSEGSLTVLRDLEGKTAWDGPLAVLVNRASASASEIVAQTLQDYGRALIIGDDHTFGKGSFQTFTLTSSKNGEVNPQGEYKVTRGRYYTVSGKSPQLTGVESDVVIPGPLSETEIGEKYAKFPLETDVIKENFEDDLSDIPYSQRQKVKLLYKFNLQPKLAFLNEHLQKLQKNASYRIENNPNYQTFLKELKKKQSDDEEPPEEEQFGQNDLQLTEAYNVVKDLIILSQ